MASHCGAKPLVNRIARKTATTTLKQRAKMRPRNKESSARLTPFGLYPKENPHPSPCNFEEHEDKEARFPLGEPLQTRHEFGSPRETENQVNENRRAV